MVEPEESEIIIFTDELKTPRDRTEESIAAKFPDRGDFPGNDIQPNPDAEPSPNVQHPE